MPLMWLYKLRTKDNGHKILLKMKTFRYFNCCSAIKLISQSLICRRVFDVHAHCSLIQFGIIIGRFGPNKCLAVCTSDTYVTFSYFLLSIHEIQLFNFRWYGFTSEFNHLIGMHKPSRMKIKSYNFSTAN